MKHIDTIYTQYGKSTNLSRKEALAKFEWVCITGFVLYAVVVWWAIL